MPKYIVNGKTYNIPDDKIEGFERKYPDANIEYNNEGKTYHIPISKRDGFLKQYPNAVVGTFTGQTEPQPMFSATATPFKQNNSVAPTPSEKPEEEKVFTNTPSATTDEEYIRGFGKGVKQGTQQLGAGLKYAGGEALDLISETSKDNADALAALEQMQAEGRDVVQETKTDAKSVLLPLLGHSGSAIDMVARIFGKKNPIANANAEVATDRTIRKALKETGGDVEAAKALLAERANEQTTADVWREEAAATMNEAKPTKGFGAWVGNMIPQMVGTTAGLGLSAVTKSPLPAQILGFGQMAALTASTAGASMKEARDAGATNGEVWATGLTDAVIELATEAIPFKGYLSPLVKQLKSRTGKAMADAVLDGKSPARKELQDLLTKANKQLGGKLFTAENAAKYIDDVLKEGASEATAEALQTITPMLYAEPENYPTLWEVFSNGVEGLKGGIFMGAVLGGASNAATNKAQRDRRKEQGFVDVAEVKFSNEQNDTGIAEVLSYDPKTNQASVLFEGEIIPIDNASENIINSHRFTFDEFDRGQIDLEQAESYDNGRNLETPQEKNDAYNMYEYQAQNMRRIFGLDEDADVDAFIGDDPYSFAITRRNENLDVGQAVLDYLNAKATKDGLYDQVNDTIDQQIEQSNKIIDSRKNNDDAMIHPATMRLNDRKVYIISGRIKNLEDGTIDTANSDKSIIIMDAETGNREFTTAADIKQADAPIDAEQEKMLAAETITNTIYDQAERDIEGVLPFNVGDPYTILDDQGVQHTVTIVADNGDGTVQMRMDNEQQDTTAKKDDVQAMFEAYNLNRLNTVVTAKKEQETKVAESSIAPTSEQAVEQAEPKPRIPLDEQGEPMYEAAPVYDTWTELLELNEGNEEEAIDTANTMRENAQAELDKAMEAPKVKGKTVPEIQAAKAQQKALIKQAQDKLNYWTDVANYRDAQLELMKRAEQRATIAKAQAASQEKGRYSEENTALGAPIDFRDYVMRSIATGGVRFIWKDSETGTRGLGSHTGLKSNEERNARIWLLNNENGLYPEEAAEQLLTSYAEELGYTPNIDTSDALSEILDVVSSYATPSSMFEAAQVRHAEINEQNIEQEAEDAQARVLMPIAESLGLSLDEYLAWEEMMLAETLPAFEADYEQITAIFVEAAQQEEILNQNNDERSTENADVQSGVHSEGRLSDGSQAGVGVLQGEQMDNGIADSRGAEAGQGSDAQVVEPSTNDIPASEVSAGNTNADKQRGRADDGSVGALENETPQVGAFGEIYTQFKGKAKEAITFLLAKRSGEAIGALHHKDVGDIDLVWGKEGSAHSDGYGLAKLAKYHPEVLFNLQELLDDMVVTARSENRVQLESEKYKAAIRLTWDNAKKTWLLTMFEKKNSVLSNTTDTDKTLSSIENDTATLENAVSSKSKDTTSEPQKQEVEQKNVVSEQEADISDEDIEALWIKSRDELWRPNDEIATILNDKLYEAHPEEHQPSDRKKVVRHLIEAAEKYKDHPIAKEVLKYVKYPKTISMRVSPLTNREEMRRKPLRARAKMWEAKVGVPVHLIETFEEVPTEDARKAILDGKAVAAWVTDGEVYLYMPYLRNRTEVDKTYIHEVVAHVGMKRLLGKEGYRQFCMRVYNEVMTEADRDFYDAYPNVKNHAQAADEYIAHLSETTDMESSIWQKVVRIFRDALRVLGIETALTNKDIQDMLRDSYQNLTNEEKIVDAIEEELVNFRFIGEVGASNLDKAEEATTRLDNLAIAREMEAADKSAKTIKMATGWERGADGKWRYEVDDIELKISPSQIFDGLENGSLYLFDVVSDASFDKLIAEYPELNDVTLSLETSDGYGYASWDDENHTIWVTRNAHKHPEHIRSSIVHEQQHAIQRIEGFAYGTNPIAIMYDVIAEKYGDNYLAEVAREDKDGSIAYDLYNIRHAAEGLVRDGKYKYLRNAVKFVANTYIKRGWINSHTVQYFGNVDSTDELVNYIANTVTDGTLSQWRSLPIDIRDGMAMAVEKYMRTSGEVEARNASDRMNMTADERRKSLAVDTEDVARRDQIFIEDALGEANTQFRITPEEDARYLQLVEEGNLEEAQKMVNAVANASGYNNDESWKKAHTAPRKSEDNVNPFNTEELVPDDYWTHPEWYTNIRNSADDRESYYNMVSAINKYKRLVAEGKQDDADKVTVKMYRGVDKTANAKESTFRNGDWITPSRSYAKLSAPYGRSRVIEQEVPLKNIWWDGNSINEWGYDDGENYVYKDTKNNRKLVDAVTYDDNGNVIPLSKRFNSRNADVRFRVVEPVPTFYSNAERAAENVKQEKATPEQWLKMIEKNGGLKAGEDKWLGLSDWLKSSDKKTLTKQEVLDFIKENQIQIEEVEYAENPQGFEDLKKEYDGWLRDGGYDYAWDKLIERYGYDSTVAFDDVGGELVVQYGNTASKLLGGEVSTINNTRLVYTTNGLDNKREIALTVPTIESWNESDEIHFGDAGNGRAIAWVRFGETTDADGNRVLVIDEVQSKRHQEGRERGYAKTEANDAFVTYRDQMMDKYGIEDIGSIYGVLNTEDKIEFDKLRTAANVEFRNSSDIPSAPFEKNWAELAMKRMLRYAAENGFDKVAWTTGDQQADRYNLGAVMQGLKAYKISPNTYYVIPYNNGAIGEFVKEYTEKELAETFGKEIAVNIITNAENATEENPYEMTGDDVRIGGSGMKAFYDQMIPSFMNKYGKKWGVKVGEVTMPSLEENNTMHSIDVTDAMRESVMQGQSMFRISDYDRQFADLQSEYDALDKDDTEALNEWREKKRNVLQSYIDSKVDELNLPVKDVYVYDGTNDEQIENIYDAYVKALDLAAEGRREDFFVTPPIEQFMSLLSERDALYLRDADIAVFNANAIDNNEANVYETMLHEQTHGVVARIIPDNTLSSIWEDAKKNSPDAAKVIASAYIGRINRGDEFLTYYTSHRLLFSQRNRARTEAYIKGEGNISADELINSTQDLLPLTNDTAKQILNFYRDEYRKKLGDGFRRERNGDEQAAQGHLGEGIRPRGAGNTRREIISAATDLAASLGVKLNVVDAIPNAPKGVKGRYSISTGQVYFVLPNATSVEDAVQTVLHEVVAHKGLRDVVGRDHFEEFLGKVFRAADTNTRRKIVALAARNGWDFNVATEEYLASLAEQGFDSRENRTFLQKVRDLFMDMLRAAKIVLGFNINDNDMRYMLWRTYQMQRSNGIMSLAEDVVMQRKLDVGNYRNRSMTEREQIIADAKANGTYLKAPNGKDTNLTPDQWVTVRTDAFKKWFGDWENDPANASKVVDANGEPKVVYNGSKVQHYNYDGRLRTKGQSATNSKVSFFTDNKDVAERYGKFVNEVFLNIRNPYEIDYNGAGWQGWSGAADGMQRASTDSYADLLANGSVDSTLERIIENYGRAEADYLASGRVRNEGVAPDGVIAYEVADPIRSTLYIVRNAEAKDISRNSVTPKGVETFTNLGKSSLLFDSQIKSATGNVGTFDPSNDDIRYRVAPSTSSTGEARQLYDDAVRRYTKKNNVKKTENLWHHLREAYQDSMLSVQKLMDAVLAETGNKLRGADDVYRAENQLSSKNKAEIEKWERDFMKPLQLEILDLVKKGASYEDIVEYLLAKHGLERNLEFSRREAEEDGKAWDGFVKRDFSGLTELTGEAEHFTEAAQQIVEEFEGKYNTDNLWSKINAATKESLKKSYDSGLMSKETYDKVANMFQYYIPLRGWDNNVAADQYEYMANKGMKILPALKTAKGRTSRADDPIATLGSVGESSIIQGNRNLMKQKFLNFAQNNPTSLLTISEQWYEQNADGTWRPSNPEIPEEASADEVDALIKEHEAKMEALGDKATKKRQGLNINLHTTKWEQEEHAVNVKRNGKEYKIFVNGNPVAAQAINGFTNPDAKDGEMKKAAMWVKNFMARAFTSMNPAFVFSNLARDLIWAGTSVAIKENAAYARQYSKNISNAMLTAQLPKLVSKWKKGTLDMNNPIEKYFHEFITNGGETGFTQLNTVDDYKRNMERFIKEAQGGVTTKAKKGWRWIWDNVEFLNRSAEDTTRFMVYLTSRQMGRPITESIANAKDITVNFNKKGRGGFGATYMNFAYIFFNATIQSLANFGKLIANHPKKTAAALTTFGASGMIAPMTALAMQAMLSGDDDEPTYWDLPEWVRRNNIVIYVGGSGYVTIPLPHELRPFYGMGELAFSTLMGKEEPDTALAKAAAGFASLMPFDYTGNAGNAAVNFTPTIAQPIAQLIVNKDYFGTPIYRKTAFNEQDPEWTKAYKSTNQLLVGATEFLNELTGGDEVKNGLIDLNPAVIEHLYEGYLGGMSKTINRAAKTLSMLWDEDARTWRNVPVASSFYQVSDERTSGSQVNREYYDVLDEAEQTEHLYRGYNKRAKMGSIEYAEKLNELINSDVFKRYQKVNSYKKAITKLNEALKQADATDREQIETLMMELKVDMLEELEQLNNR